MNKVKIGCAGWEYRDWVGIFYPKDMENYQHLEHYSKFFNLNEVNSPFYSPPSIDLVEKWNMQVPQDFRYIIKVWQEITHKSKEWDLEEQISTFFYRFSILKDKISGFLLQFPPWFTYTEKHLARLRYILSEIPSEHRYFIEMRDNSWFDEEILNQFIDGKTKVLVTSYLKDLVPYFMKKQESYYIRLIGDRQLEHFNMVQRKQEEEIDSMIERVKFLVKEPTIREIFIIVNNHYTGFAPETVNTIKKKFGIPYEPLNVQKSLLDF